LAGFDIFFLEEAYWNFGTTLRRYQQFTFSVVPESLNMTLGQEGELYIKYKGRRVAAPRFHWRLMDTSQAA
jgi:hypothetical protein